MILTFSVTMFGDKAFRVFIKVKDDLRVRFQSNRLVSLQEEEKSSQVACVKEPVCQ